MDFDGRKNRKSEKSPFLRLIKFFMIVLFCLFTFPSHADTFPTIQRLHSYLISLFIKTTNDSKQGINLLIKTPVVFITFAYLYDAYIRTEN